MINQVILIGKVTRHDTMTTYIELKNKEEIPIPHEYLSTKMQDALRSINEETTLGLKGHLTTKNKNLQIQATKITFLGEEEKETWS